MRRFSELIVRRRKWVLAIWLVAAVLIVGLSPSISSVESNNQSSFLPKGYESVQAINIANKVSSNSQDATDLVVFTNKNNQPLGSADMHHINEAIQNLSHEHLSHILSITTSDRQLSPNHKVQLGQITYSGNPQGTATIDTVKTIRDGFKTQLAGSNVTSAVTGGEAISYDTQGESEKAIKIVSIGTLLLVLILPAFIFRSPFAGLLPIASVGVVDLIANSLIADAAKLFHFVVSQQLSVIFTVVLFGIGTDYILFLLFRYRERLRSGDHSRTAVTFALSRAGLAILSAALVVLSSFSALFFAKFGIFSTMAPSLVICVCVMMLAALTLIPALVAIVQEKVFWPSKAWKSHSLKPTVSKKIGHGIAKRPGTIVILVVLFLLILSSFALGYTPDFSSFSEPPKGTESAIGYNELTAAFPAGVINPTEVYVSGSSRLTQSELMPLVNKLVRAPGVSSVLPTEIVPNGKIAIISVVLKNDPNSAIAISEVGGPIHAAAHSVTIPGARVYVGGETAIVADIKAVTNRDLKVIFPIAAVFIFVILAVLLRSLVAPVFLLLCVGLGYVATLGATTLIFQKIGHAPGLIFFIPLFMYIFVVAIGTDYNILTITRLREEIQAKRSPRKAADLAVEHSSATVASAGLILAATFGSLLLANISFLSQMGSAIAIGVVLAAFIIAPFLIPSLSALVGYAIWWPGYRNRKLAELNQDTKLTIQVIIGSTRPNRIGPEIAAWVLQQLPAYRGVTYEVVDIAQWHLPLFNEPQHPARGQYIYPYTRAWSQKIREADGYIFLTPEYNAGYPASLKNAIDYLYNEWTGKPALIISYGVRGGQTAALQLRQVTERLKMHIVEQSPAYAIPNSAVSRNGHVKDIEQTLKPFGAKTKKAGQALLRLALSLTDTKNT